MLTHRALVLLALAPLALLDPLGLGRAEAQTAPPDWSLRVLDLPPGLAGGPQLGETVSGFFGGAALRSSVVLRGDAPLFAFAPHLGHAFVEVDAGAPSIDHLARWPGGIEPGHDAVLGVGPNGLARFHYDPRLGRLMHAPGPGSAIWDGARTLGVADLDVDGHLDVFGVSADGGWLLVLHGTAAGFGAETQHPLPFPGSRAVALDYQDGPALEVLVLTDAGLCALDASGDLLWMIGETGPSGEIAAVRSASGASGVAWTTWDAAGGRWLLNRFDASGADAPLPLLVAPPGGGPPVALNDVVGLSAGDWDADGVEDLAVAHTAFQSGVVLLQQPGGGFSTQASATRLIELTVTPGATAPVVADAFAFEDHHGTGHDTVVAAVGADGLVAATKLSAEEIAQEKILEGVSIFRPAMNADGGPGAAMTVWLTFNELPHEWVNRDRVQVLCWRQAEPDADLEPVVAYNRLFEIEPLLYGLDGWYLSLELPDELPGEAYRLGYLQVRFVDLSQGRIVDASRDVIVGYTDEPDTASGVWAEYLQQRSGADIADLIACALPPPLDCAGNGEVGGVVPQDDVPPPPPGVAPVYGTPTARAERLTPFYDQ